MQALLLKFIAFMATLLALQSAVAALHPPALPEEILALERHLENQVDLIYLGDSTLIYPFGEITTAEILQEHLPDHVIGEIAHPAYHSDLYAAYASSIADHGRADHDRAPETVIIPINMRSFSPEWDLRPSYQFEREKTVLNLGPYLSRLLYRPLDTLGGFDPAISEETFLSASVYADDERVGLVADFEDLIGNNASAAQNADLAFAYHTNLPSQEDVDALKGLLTYYYLYPLTPEHRKLEALVKSGQILKQNGIEPIFYITPINHELGRSHLGEAFRDHVAENVAQVEEALRRQDIDVLNLVFDLEAFNFVDTEHLTESGKTYVAESLASVIDPSHSGPLTSANSKDGSPTRRPIWVAAATTIAPTATPTPAISVTVFETATLQQRVEIAATAEPASPALPSPTPTPTNTRVVPAGGLPPGSEPGRVSAVEYLGAFQPVGNYGVDLYRFQYQTYGLNDQPVEVRANLYVPQSGESSETLPVLVYGGGTTGLSAVCAPLDELARGGNWGSYHYQMLEYSAQGFITLWPEGQGFNQGESPHPYFIAEPQARAMLDGARAAINFFNESQASELTTKPADTVFLGGYSSGGHAAFAAKELAGDYAPELPIKGIIGHGPTTDPEILLQESPIFSPYLIHVYQTLLGEEIIDPNRVFQERWVANFEADVTQRCVDNIFAYYSHSTRQMYRPEFREALLAGRLQSIAPAFDRALAANTAGLSRQGTDIPILILQGTADTVIRPDSQTEFANALCQLGHRVTYNSYPAVSHADTRRVSFRDTIAWMRGVAAGDLPNSSCSTLSTP